MKNKITVIINNPLLNNAQKVQRRTKTFVLVTNGKQSLKKGSYKHITYRNLLSQRVTVILIKHRRFKPKEEEIPLRDKINSSEHPSPLTP